MGIFRSQINHPSQRGAEKHSSVKRKARDTALVDGYQKVQNRYKKVYRGAIRFKVLRSDQPSCGRRP